jgi:hypothetical protein
MMVDVFGHSSVSGSGNALPRARYVGFAGGTASGCRSAERKRERFHARIEELDLEHSVDDRPRLSNQLIQALFGRNATALFVDIATMSVSGRPAIEQDTESHGTRVPWRSHDKMEIPPVEGVCDSTARLV